MRRVLLPTLVLLALAGCSGPSTTDVTIQTGAIGLAFTEPPASVQVSSRLGAVEVGLPRGTAYAVDVKTEVGKATVSVDNDAASEHRVEVRTGVGAVNIEPSS